MIFCCVDWTGVEIISKRADFPVSVGVIVSVIVGIIVGIVVGVSIDV